MQRVILIGPMESGRSIIGRRLVEQSAARFRMAVAGFRIDTSVMSIDEAVEEMAGFLSDCADD
ncbi:hypothetical protein ACFL3K_02320 [Pseudomonadota bacterium]